MCMHIGLHPLGAWAPTVTSGRNSYVGIWYGLWSAPVRSAQSRVASRMLLAPHGLARPRCSPEPMVGVRWGTRRRACIVAHGTHLADRSSVSLSSSFVCCPASPGGFSAALPPLALPSASSAAAGSGAAASRTDSSSSSHVRFARPVRTPGPSVPSRPSHQDPP